MNNSDNKNIPNNRSENQDPQLRELLRRAGEDAGADGEELVNLAEDVHALTADYDEDKAILASIP